MPSASARILAVIWSLIVTALISAIGAGIWSLLITTNLLSTPKIPWAVVVMAVILWVGWLWLNGRGWPRRTSATRRDYLRANRLPNGILAWGVAASVLALAALAGIWIVLVELTGAGGNPTIPDYSRFPPLTVVLGLVMGSLVSPITEEAAFRGYAQVRLERVFPAAVAIVLSSLLFMLWHGPTQGFVWSKLLFYFLVGVAFGLTAFLTNSTLPALPTHILGDLTFFFLVWPHDAARPLVWRDGAGLSFWLAAVWAVVFTFLAVLAFRRLARLTAGARTAPAKATAPAI